MLTLLHRFSKYSVVILGFLAITLSHAQDDRDENISILDVDSNGEVDALTDGLLLLRSMFGLTDDVLINGVVSPNASVTDSTAIDSYISSIKGTTYGELTSGGGPQGPQGEKGEKGDAGADGSNGATGAKGDKGDAGTQGIQGVTGVQGDKGDKGDTGVTGADGSDGSDGATGPQGATGAAGADGSDGATGPQGATGAAGADGSDGATGPQGATGATGAAGADGSDGSDGSDGATGPQGATGATGAAGAAGATGASGVAGSMTQLTDALVEDGSLYIGNDPSGTTSTAAYNVAVGTTALDSVTTGDSNVALGYDALDANTTGDNNTAIGYAADVSSNNLDNATAIGNGAIVAASNTMQLGNTSVTNVKTSGSITAGAITIPNTDGVSGQVLKTNGSGTLSWVAKDNSSGFWGADYIHATGSQNMTSYRTLYYQIYASKTMTIDKLSVWGFWGGSNAPTIMGGVYRGSLGDSGPSSGGTLIGQGSKIAQDGRNQFSITAESGQNLNITELEPLILALYVPTVYFSPEIYCTGDTGTYRRSRYRSNDLSSLPSTPDGYQPWGNSCKFIAYIH